MDVKGVKKVYITLQETLKVKQNSEIQQELNKSTL